MPTTACSALPTARRPGACCKTTAACDIILLDLMMPVMNGWDFRRKQKDSPNFSAIPVVLMSAGGNIASSCADLDTSDYIAKPVEVEELLNKIQRYCS
jgi:two-component system chemotaxis response regulator CheY